MPDNRRQVINYIAEDLEKLNSAGLLKVYKLIRRELIADLPINDSIKKQLKDLNEYEEAEWMGQLHKS